MKILVFSNGRNDIYKYTVHQFEAELMHRKHDVHVLYSSQSEGKIRPSSKWSHHPARKAEKANFQAMVKKYSTVFREHTYDMVIATHISCGKILNHIYNSETVFFPYMVYLPLEDDHLPRKARLSFDEYIIQNEAEKKQLQRWGVPASLIHLVEVEKQVSYHICSLIEESYSQWSQLKQAFQIGI